MVDVRVTVVLMFKCYNYFNMYISKMSIHPATRSVRRIVRCEGIVSLEMSCFIDFIFCRDDVTSSYAPLEEPHCLDGVNRYYQTSSILALKCPSI